MCSCHQSASLFYSAARKTRWNMSPPSVLWFIHTQTSPQRARFYRLRETNVQRATNDSLRNGFATFISLYGAATTHTIVATRNSRRLVCNIVHYPTTRHAVRVNTHTTRTTGAIRVNTLCQERRAAAAAAAVVAAAQVVVETRAMAVITSRASSSALALTPSPGMYTIL